MPYRGDKEQYVQDCWKGKIHDECYSESGLLDLTAMSYEDHRGETVYGVFVNNELAYQSSKSHQASRLYDDFKRS